jgi:hypothetical protein
MQNPVFVEAEVQALIHENTSFIQMVLSCAMCRAHGGLQRRWVDERCMKIVEPFVILQAA